MPKYGCIQIPWWPAVLDSKLLFPFWRMTIAKELHPCMCESASSPNVVFRKISLLPSRWTQRRQISMPSGGTKPRGLRLRLRVSTVPGSWSWSW